jgi:hypothetical protein
MCAPALYMTRIPICAVSERSSSNICVLLFLVMFTVCFEGLYTHWRDVWALVCVCAFVDALLCMCMDVVCIFRLNASTDSKLYTELHEGLVNYICKLCVCIHVKTLSRASVS